MPGSILGNRVVRKEDPKFLTTGDVYVDDLNGVPELAGAVHVAYARSTVAHGTITSIDVDEAKAMPGVLGVFTAGDLGLEPVNPLGAKGIGESGTIGSTPAVQSAVIDAVAHLGVRHIDMPASGERVWQAVRAAAG